MDWIKKALGITELIDKQKQTNILLSRIWEENKLSNELQKTAINNTSKTFSSQMPVR
mgnify:CR=1 FL=1|tara:strand:- start:447 stop:617 length:171 start_codon:yes stop_codon:yes gene_type:complete